MINRNFLILLNGFVPLNIYKVKEAVIKCLSGYERPVMSDLDIINDEEGKPEIFYKDYRILVSISHEKTYATAVALLQESE